MSSRLRRSMLAAFATICLGSAAQAQMAPPPPTEVPPPPPPPPVMLQPPPAAVPPMAPPPAPPPPAPAATPAGMVPPAVTPFKIENSTGTLRIGLLAQPQFQMLGAPNADSNNFNLYVRRIRLIVAGSLFNRFEYFFDTDYPNLFLSGPGAPGAMVVVAVPKNTPGMNVQDAFVTYKAVGDMFKLDVGYMLPPLAHNAVQGATTLYSWDYFQNTFLSTNSFGSQNPPGPVGRDAGVQARGLVVDGHLEYRVGLFQGFRNPPQAPPANNVGGRNMFRFAARVQINLLDPETGFFYAGTYLGAKRILSFGASFDHQQDDGFSNGYTYWDVDGFADMPLGAGVFTAQIDMAHWHGGTFLPAPGLPPQYAFMSEIGYRFNPVFISPIFRFEDHWFSGAGTTEMRFAPGVAFWPFGHNSNLKLFYTRIHLSSQPPGDHDYNQINLQWQVFFL
jgi:hypothetical protein